MLAAWFALPAIAQDTLPLPAPNLRLVDGGSVEVLVRQADGGVLMAGYFSLVNGVPRASLARLRPDASLDLDWDADVIGGVEHVALAPDGSIFIAGRIAYVHGHPRKGVAKLKPDGSLDSTWLSPLNHYESVQALAVGPDGAVYLGGRLELPGGVVRHVMKLDGRSGAVDAGWAAVLDPNEFVFDIEVDGDAVYLGGRFTSLGSTARARTAKLSAATGELDAAWQPVANDQVNEIAVDGSGNVYLGGFFTQIDDTAQHQLAKLDTQGHVVANWNPSPDGFVHSIGFADDGAVLVGGSYETIGGVPRHGAARLSPSDGSVQPGLDIEFGKFSHVRAIATIGNSGRLLLGGNFVTAAGEQRLGLLQLQDSVPTPEQLDAGVYAILQVVASQSDGSMLVGGQFLSVDGMPRAHLLRLRPDGQLDEAWQPMLDGPVRAIAVDSHDDIYIGGHFGSVDGQPSRYLAKLDGETARRVPWSPAPNGLVYALAVDAQDNVYVGGAFDRIGDAPRHRGARYTRDLVLTDWDPGLASTVRAIAHSAAGVYLGSEPGLGRFNIADGVRDASWNPAPNGGVLALTIDDAGRVYAGGDYTQIGGATRRSLARLDPITAAADPLWIPAASNYTTVNALANDGAGALYVGGAFQQLGGQARNNVAKLALASGAADATWRPQPDLSLLGLHVTPAGNIAATGFFRNISGQRRDGLALLPSVQRERMPQQIAFTTPAPGPYVFGGTAGAVHATASSGLAVRYDSRTPTLCDVDADSGEITIHGAGDCIASADQDGDEENWLPAPQATQTVVIDKAAQTPLTVAANPTSPGVGETAALAVNGGTGIGTLSFAVTAGTAICEIVPPATLHALAAGDCTVTATKAADHNHLPATASVVLRVRPALPERVFGNGFE
jgi:hypothetical protein